MHVKPNLPQVKDYRHLLVAAVRNDTSPDAREMEKLPPAQIPDHVTKMIRERADPTVAKSMTTWLVRQYAQSKLRLEDIGAAHETLAMFQRYAPQLPEGDRDLERYDSLADVWDAVCLEKNQISGKTSKVKDRARAEADSHVLLQGKDEDLPPRCR